MLVQLEGIVLNFEESHANISRAHLIPQSEAETEENGLLKGPRGFALHFSIRVSLAASRTRALAPPLPFGGLGGRIHALTRFVTAN